MRLFPFALSEQPSDRELSQIVKGAFMEMTSELIREYPKAKSVFVVNVQTQVRIRESAIVVI